MNNLWIFGDSFSVGRQDIKKGKTISYKLWYEFVAQNLECEYYHNYAQWGVSNEYIINEFMSRKQEYKEGDFIIIQLTDVSRQWFFPDHPDLANIHHVIDMSEHLPKEKYKAIESYLKYLDNDPIKYMKYTLYCMAINYQAITDLSKCKILIIPGFNNIPTVNGTLLSVCNGEFVDDDSLHKWYSKHRFDPRPNHLSIKNHEILGNKVSYYFLNGGYLDLINDFEKGFLSVANQHNYS